MTSYPNRAGHTPQRSAKLRAALEYAERGIPVFPCKSGGKKPVIPKCPDATGLSGEQLASHTRNCSRNGHGYYDATTDRSRITAWWNRWPNANIGAPTGKASGFFVVDVDRDKWGFGSLEALEEEHGKLPDTYTVKTGGGGMHLYFRYPEDVEIKNSAGELGPGLDVRGKGGYVLLPGSATEGTYDILEDLPTAEASGWLLHLLAENGTGTHTRSLSDEREALRSASTLAARSTTAGPIPDGRRNVTLTSVAGRMHDGTRDLDALYLDLLQVNAARCTPPLPEQEVWGIASSIYSKPPCRPSKKAERDPQIDEVLDAVSDYWWGRMVPGGGRAKRRDVFRGHIELAREHGRITKVLVEGEERRAVAYSASTRQVALKANAGVASVDRAKKVFLQRGIIEKDDADRRDGEAGIFLLIEPAQRWNTLSSPPPMGGCSTNARPPRADELQTPTPRWGDPGIGNARAGILYALEAFGPQTAQQIAQRVGVRRVRDLKRRHLEELERLGLVEESEGKWVLARAYAQKVEMVCRTPYTTVRKERRHSLSPEGRRVAYVGTSTVFASAVERQEQAARRFKEQSERYRNRRKVKAEPVHQKQGRRPDGEISELERVEDPSLELVEAVRVGCHRFPRQPKEHKTERAYAFWLANSLWAYELVEYKPTGATVEVALYQLRHGNAA